MSDSDNLARNSDIGGDIWNHRCHHCGQYSLTYDWPRNGYICHVYAGFIPEERMPRR